jgi:hypothetical protein
LSRALNRHRISTTPHYQCREYLNSTGTLNASPERLRFKQNK